MSVLQLFAVDLNLLEFALQVGHEVELVLLFQCPDLGVLLLLFLG